MGNPDKNPIPGNKKFGTDQSQPSPEAKKAGWERKQEAQKIMDEMLSLTSKSYKEIKELLDDIKVHPENHTLREVKIANYLMEKKFTVDYLDRHISKAPQELDITTRGGVIVNDEEATKLWEKFNEYQTRRTGEDEVNKIEASD